MENSTPNQQPTANIPVKKSKPGFSVSKWLSNLFGKSTPPSSDVPQANVETQKVSDTPTKTTNMKAVTPSDDSVQEDIEKFKNLVNTLAGKASVKSAPVIESGKEKTAETFKKVGKVVDVSFMRKMVRALIVFVFLFVVAVLAYRFYRITKQNGINIEEPIGDPQITITYTPYKESVYTTDPELNQIEESINTLKREVLNTQLRINNLNPPILDFNISF